MSSSPGPYQATDTIVNSNFTPFSPSVSRVRQDDLHSSSAARHSQPQASETAPLLGNGAGKPAKKPFYRPRPLWLVPFAIVASIVRGMTLAPRVQVFTQLSCNSIYGHDIYDHTSDNHTSTLASAYMLPSTHFLSSLDPAGPSLNLHSTAGTYVTFTSGSDSDDEPDPRQAPSKRCVSDPRVQAGAAKIQTLMVTTMGGLSALTTGWWGHYGEQHGRTRVLAAATLGLLLTDLTFILVSTPHSPFAAHGHKLLIISPILEGLLGGWSTLQGATSAYVSDCTSDGSRAKIFSRFTGVFYLGFSLGPTIGAYLIRHPLFTHNPSSSTDHHNVHNGQPTVTSVFYVAAMCSFINLLLVLFVFPESINKKKAKAAGKTSQVVIAPAGEQSQGGAQQSSLQRILSPLTLFTPKKIPRPEGGYRNDWSLGILGIAMSVFLLAAGVFQIKYLYAEHVYEWGAEQLSYYITFMGGVRAVHLLFVMPYLISTFKPKQKPKAAAGPTPSTSTTITPGNNSKPVSTSKKPKPTLGHLVKEMKFDLMLLRISFLLEFLSHALVSFLSASMGAGYFVAATTLSSFGAGVIPAVNSLALCIMQMQAQAGGAGNGATTDDGASAGRLFGALAALQSVGQMIFGPLIFGIIYSQTVGTFPKAIFVVAASITAVGFILLCLLRPDVAMRTRVQRRTRREDEVERGRSRISKEIGKPIMPLASGSGSSSGSTPQAA